MFVEKSFAFGFLFALALSPIFAGTPDFRSQVQAQPLPPSDARFNQWHFELSLVTGALYSPIRLDVFPQPRTTFDYTQTEIRAGVMLNSPYDAGFFRGNFEFLVGLGGGAVLDGPGSALGNGDIFIRYNFIPKHSRFVPYTQLGAGLVVSDASNDQNQRIIGRTLEFSLQMGTGLRILFDENWSLDVEAIYQHISNANTANRNVGVNAVGGLLGLTRSL